MCREIEMPEAEASLRNSIDRRVYTSWKVLAPKRFVSIGIYPNVSSISLNRIVNSAQSAYFRTGRMKNNRTKSPKKDEVTKVQLLLWIVYDSWVVYHKTLSRKIMQRLFHERSPRVLGTILSSMIRKELHAASSKNPRKQRRSIALEKSSQKFLIREVPTLWNL